MVAYSDNPADFVQQQVQRRRIPAWLLSCMLHTVILIVLIIAFSATMRQGASLEPNREGGIVLAKTEDGKTDYFESPRQGEETSSDTETSTAASGGPEAAMPSGMEATLEESGILATAEDLVGGTGLENFLPGTGEATTGDVNRTIGGGKAKTYVFGVPGEGRKFVYVFDRSSSMNDFDGRPIKAAKNQLLKSLKDLGQLHQFQIIFYNKKSRILNEHDPRILFANDQNKEMARRFVLGMEAFGGTDHMQALNLAINMRPDVIFFLTDAAEPSLSASELDSIRRRNRSAVINAIEFGSGVSPPGDNFLKRLARQNDGQHVYIDMSKLRAD